MASNFFQSLLSLMMLQRKYRNLIANSVCLVGCRYLNTPYKELSLAACEQMKITELRLKKLLDPEDKATEAGEQIERRSGQLRSHLGEPCVLVPNWNQ